MDGVTPFHFFLGFGIIWVPLALILLTEPEGKRSPWKVLLSSAVGWIGMWAAFVGWGMLGG
jgi:hypothetical protein